MEKVMVGFNGSDEPRDALALAAASRRPRRRSSS